MNNKQHTLSIPETLKYWVGFSLISWVVGSSLALVDHPSSDGVTMKIPYGVNIPLHQPVLHPIFSY